MRTLENAADTVEANRGGYNSVVAPFDLMDSFLPAFRAAVVEGNAAGIMCSYSTPPACFRPRCCCPPCCRLLAAIWLLTLIIVLLVVTPDALNGVPTCANEKLTEILREHWQFDGYITSDSGAIRDIYGAHKYNKTAAEATAAALLAGCDINSGSQYSHNVEQAVRGGLINESVVDAALINAFKVRIRLGLFDPPQGQPDYSDPEIVGSPKYHALSADASRQAMTLLSNKGNALPLTPGRKLAVIGANAVTKTLMAGGTGGGLLSAEVVCKGAKNRTDWWCITSPYEAIHALNAEAGGTTTLSAGAAIHGVTNESEMLAAIAAAKAADAVVFVIGGDWKVEHEAMDRSDITLPGNQSVLIRRVRAAVPASTRVVAVMVHGGSMDITEVLDSSDAVLDSF